SVEVLMRKLFVIMLLIAGMISLAYLSSCAPSAEPGSGAGGGGLIQRGLELESTARAADSAAAATRAAIDRAAESVYAAQTLEARAATQAAADEAWRATQAAAEVTRQAVSTAEAQAWIITGWTATAD